MRPSRDETLMETAEVWAKRSTCSRLWVGAVFSVKGRILVQGYNGAPQGLPHCEHRDGSVCTTAEHAERNGIAWAARKGVRLEGSELHVTNMPCLSCSMSVVNAGVVRVVWKSPYRLTEGIELLASAGVEVVDFSSLVA